MSCHAPPELQTSTVRYVAPDEQREGLIVDLIGVVHIGGAVLQPQTLLAMQLGVGATWFVNRRWTDGLGRCYLLEPEDLLSVPLNLGADPIAFSLTAASTSPARQPATPRRRAAVRSDEPKPTG